MKGPGLFTMLQFALGLSLAGPMFIVGFEFARTGRVALGVGFFALGAVVSYAPTYLFQRIGGPRAWIRRRLERRRERKRTDSPSVEPTEEAHEGADAPGDGDEGESRNWIPRFIDRTRRR